MLLDVLFACLRRFPPAFRLRMYSFLWRIGKKWYGPTDFFVQRIPGNMYMKRGIKASQEADAMRIVIKHTTIPVPTVLDAVGDCIIMTRLPGEPLGNVFSEMGVEQVSNIQVDLAAIVHQLRSIPSEAEGVISGPHPTMPCCDVNRVDELAFGPFSNLTDFHEYLFTRIPPQKASKIRKEAALIHAKSHRVFFTHGDLNLRNILVEKGRVTGIVDWTCAGWYPGYWELGKAIYVHRRFQKWLDMWSHILPGYEAELDVEMKMWDYDSF